MIENVTFFLNLQKNNQNFYKQVLNNKKLYSFTITKDQQ